MKCTIFIGTEEVASLALCMPTAIREWVATALGRCKSRVSFFTAFLALKVTTMQRQPRRRQHSIQPKAWACTFSRVQCELLERQSTTTTTRRRRRMKITLFSLFLTSSGRVNSPWAKRNATLLCTNTTKWVAKS